MKFSSPLVLALWLAGAVAPAASQTAPASAEAPKAAQEGARKEVLEALQAAQALLKDNKPQEALDKLKTAGAVPDRTAYENFFIDQLTAQAAALVGQDLAAVDAYDRALASGRYNADEVQRVLRAQVTLAFRAKAYPRSIGYARKLLATPGLAADFRTSVNDLLGRSLYLESQYPEAAVVMTEWLNGLQAAGATPSEEQIKLLASAYLQAKDDAGYQRALERMLAAHPKPAYWADLIARNAKLPGLDQRLRLDLLRLGRATGAFVQPDALLEAAYVAQQAGLPGEARRVLQAGLGENKFQSSGDQARVREQLASATKAATADAASADDQARRLKGQALFGLGHALALDGQVDRGIGLMRQALDQGGLRNADDALLQLGVQQALAGKPEARQTLSQVKGTDGAELLARWWRIHLRLN